MMLLYTDLNRISHNIWEKYVCKTCSVKLKLQADDYMWLRLFTVVGEGPWLYTETGLRVGLDQFMSRDFPLPQTNLGGTAHVNENA